jgi:hypothetical protein
VILVLSGEGPTDLGQCNNAQGLCSDPYFQPGPMAVLVDNIVAKKLKYSMLAVTPAAVRYVGEQFLANLAKARKGNRVSLVGKKQGQETAYFYINAWMLGEFAQKLEEDEEDEAVAVFFRDCDGTRAAANSLWNEKYQSIVDGFLRSGFQRGVPMLPKPKSEAWLLCAAQTPPYNNCVCLEDLPGNDASPNSAKMQLQLAFPQQVTSASLVAWLMVTPFDETKAAVMPSFDAFLKKLWAAI